MKILYRLRAAAYFALSRSSRMLSTPVLEAASISKTSIDFPKVISSQDGHRLHGVIVGPSTQFRPLARIRAVVVFPTPRVPKQRPPRPTRFTCTALCDHQTRGSAP